ALQQELKDLEEQNKGRMFINRGREDQLRRQLKDLMDAELEALEERKQAELTELAAWLDEEQRVQDDAYQEAIDKQIAAAVAQAEERLLQYGRQLEDLEKALGQEKEELNRRYNERLADLEQAHSRQLEEMKRAHEEQLAAMDVQLAQEKVRLAEAAQQRRDSLAEQLADEQVAYRDRKKALDEALVDEKDTITTRLGEQSQIVTDKALEMTKNMADAWDKIDPAVANALRMVTYNTIIPWVNSVLDEIRRMKTGIEHELDSSPISGWFLGVGKSMGRGLEQGFDLKGILGAQIDELSQFKVQAEGVLEVGSPSKWASRLGENVTESFGDKAVLEPSIGSFAMDAFESDIPSVPGQDMALDPFLTGMPDIPSQEMAITPYLLDVQALAEQSQVQAPTPPMMAAGGMGGGSTMNRINNVQFDAHYKRYESERSLRDHIDLLRIGMRW
ncbi:MAG TPA: hypothetical protein VM537_17270, partial [Anaerolineae bacterium]|nr:hypothetical protein [Anaerolineae bacterium]